MPISARELVRFLKRKGFAEKRQHGSHLILKRFSDGKRAVVPMHSGDVHKTTLLNILKDTGYTLDELRND